MWLAGLGWGRLVKAGVSIYHPDPLVGVRGAHVCTGTAELMRLVQAWSIVNAMLVALFWATVRSNA
jgi:hypothetical protein